MTNNVVKYPILKIPQYIPAVRAIKYKTVPVRDPVDLIIVFNSTI